MELAISGSLVFLRESDEMAYKGTYIHDSIGGSSHQRPPVTVTYPTVTRASPIGAKQVTRVDQYSDICTYA